MTCAVKQIDSPDDAMECIPPRQWFDWFLMATASAAIMLATAAMIDWIVK